MAGFQVASEEYTTAVFDSSPHIQRLADWLYDKTLGHPYFLAFISRQLLVLSHGLLADPELLWPEIFKRLEHEKFRSDLAQVTEREVQLLREIARTRNDEVSPREMNNRYERKYFSRLAEKALLVRVGRGRYKLYHPLFRLFLQEG